jgi:hypothetical protein
MPTPRPETPRFDPAGYSPAIAELLREPRLAPLGPGSPNRGALPGLQRLTVETAFAPHPVRDRDMARACLAGLWLYHDFLDESHTISQDLAGATGSYWHGLMHRREPDYGNAAYWFRRVGRHPVFAPLGRAAAELAAAQHAGPETAFLARQSAWDPFAFIDLCESVKAGRATCDMLCRQVQQREWELLFDFCYQLATGRDAETR